MKEQQQETSNTIHFAGRNVEATTSRVTLNGLLGDYGKELGRNVISSDPQRLQKRAEFEQGIIEGIATGTIDPADLAQSFAKEIEYRVMYQNFADNGPESED